MTLLPTKSHVASRCVNISGSDVAGYTVARRPSVCAAAPESQIWLKLSEPNVFGPGRPALAEVRKAQGVFGDVRAVLLSPCTASGTVSDRVRGGALESRGGA